jgi:hypothetical protein
VFPDLNLVIKVLKIPDLNQDLEALHRELYKMGFANPQATEISLFLSRPGGPSDFGPRFVRRKGIVCRRKEKQILRIAFLVALELATI